MAALELAVASPTHRRLRSALRRADDYAQWFACARALDASRGVALWQADLRSTRYNWPFVRRLRARLRTARSQNDWRGVADTLRLCSRPNVGGIMAPELFAVSYAGRPKSWSPILWTKSAYGVLAPSYAVDATRLHLSMKGVVFFSSSGRFAGRRERRLALVDVLRRRAHEGLSQSFWRRERSVWCHRVSSVGWRCPRHVPLRAMACARCTTRAYCRTPSAARRPAPSWPQFLLLPKRLGTRPRLV